MGKLTRLEAVLASIAMMSILGLGAVAMLQGHNGAVVQLSVGAVLGVLIIVVLKKVPSGG